MSLCKYVLCMIAGAVCAALGHGTEKVLPNNKQARDTALQRGHVRFSA